MAYKQPDRNRDIQTATDVAWIRSRLEGTSPPDPPIDPPDPPDPPDPGTGPDVPDPMPAPIGAYRFDLAQGNPLGDKEVVNPILAGGWAPIHRRDVLDNWLKDCPSGLVRQVYLRIVMTGVPANTSLANLIAWFVEAKGGGAGNNKNMLFYPFFKGSKVTWRQGWNVEHKDKTKESKTVGWDDASVLECVHSYAANSNEAVWNGSAKVDPQGLIGPANIGNNGVRLDLGGDPGDNPNETSIIGVRFWLVDGWIEFA